MSVMLKAGLIVHVVAFLAVAEQEPQPGTINRNDQSAYGFRVPNWFDTLCRENGLTHEQRQHLRGNLTMPNWADDGNVRSWKSKDVDIVPILIALIEDHHPHLLGSGPESLPVAPSRILRWLGLLRDDRASAYLLKMTREALAKGVGTQDEGRDLEWLFLSVGWSGTERAVEFLWTAQTDEFWEGEQAPQINLPADGTRTAEQVTEGWIERLKSGALRALAEARSDHVLRALATGEGLNQCLADQFDNQFAHAARQSIGLVGYPENFGKALSEGWHEKLRGVYEEYGKEYKPRPVTPNPSGLRSSLAPPWYYSED